MAPPGPARQSKDNPPPQTGKRKTDSNLASNARKRAKTYDARTLAVQSSNAALSNTGELNLSAFVASREYEIRALEAGIRNARNALTSRAFQKVPRSLRRRTASHNVKRVPARLRARARREMMEDNTPTVTARRRKPTEQMRLRLETARRLQSVNARSKIRRKAAKAASGVDKKDSSAAKEAGVGTDAEHAHNIAPRVPKVKKDKLSHPEKPVSKFKKRQRGKAWLPTHMFHAKRAHMSESKAPLWRFAIPMTPTEKSYRPTHRANGARGAIAWDMSYMSTIGLEGVESSIEGLLKAMGVDGEGAWGAKGKKWRAGTRALEAWMHERDAENLLIAPVTLIWCAPDKFEDVEMVDADKPPTNTKPVKRKMFIRVHPSAFLQLWVELLKVSKIQKPPVTLEDLRFEIGSIEISGPGSTEALLAALTPVFPSKEGSRADHPEALWQSLAGVTNPSSLPKNALLAFSISDPRLRHPPRTTKILDSEEDASKLARILSSWPPDATLSKPELFSRPARLLASRLLPSQKAISKRKALASPGEYPAPKPTDPSIPIVVFVSQLGGSSRGSNSQGRWTVLLPWKCVTPVWYSIMYYPLSSGGNPRFGGVKEQQQLAFESGEAWFPGDFPGTRAGWVWELRQRELQKIDWERRPKGKRVEFDSVHLGHGKRGEIGRGWACDWERLVNRPPKANEDSKRTETADTTRNGKTKQKPKIRSVSDEKAVDSILDQPLGPPHEIHQLVPSDASTILSNKLEHIQALLAKPALATVKINLVSRGTPTPCARIYRLPTTNPTLRDQWLSLLSQPSSSNRMKNTRSKQLIIPNPIQTVEQGEEPAAREALLSSLLPSDPKNSSDHLPTPDETDLIGFVTTGNYNLSSGKGTGIGVILVNKIEVYAPTSPPSALASVDAKARAASAGLKIGKAKLTRTCIVRAAGESVGRLGWWEI